MTKRGFLARHGIVRNAIREDLVYYALPALLVFTAGLVVSVLHGWDRLIAAILHLVGQPANPHTLSVQNILGLALIAAGIAVLFVAASTLRRFYSSTLVIKEDHKLITHGIYGYTRHPIYLGVIMVSIGIPLSAASLYGLLIMLALIPVLLNRIRMEERLLTEEFGDNYLAYRDSTSKLIPFVY
jgi:protein-S-isoprenylcysteine O-methyltransferase Ste14